MSGWLWKNDAGFAWFEVCAVENRGCGCYSGVYVNAKLNWRCALANAVWQAVLGEIELSVSRASFSTWFKNTTLLENDDEEVVIGVPNVFTKQQLEEKYQDLLQEKLQKNGLENPKIRFVIHEKPSPQQQSNPTDWSVRPTPAKTTPATHSNLNDKYDFANFVVGGGNEVAYAAAQAVAKGPGSKYNPLFIYGGVGLGKTHLIQAIGNEVKRLSPDASVVYVTSEQFATEFVASILRKKTFSDKYRNADVLIVDDMQFIAGKEKTEEEFFHTFNTLHQANKQIIISSDKPPKSIPTLEERLRSRFEWGMTADIQPPDFETRIAIIQSKARDHGMSITDTISEYLATHIQSNIRELEGALTKVLAHCEMTGQPLSLEIVEQILGTGRERRQRLTEKHIIERTAKYFNLTVHEITSSRRDKTIAEARQIAMFLLRNELHLSFPAVAKALGRKDHTTAMHSVQKIDQAIQQQSDMRQTVQAVKEQVYV